MSCIFLILVVVMCFVVMEESLFSLSMFNVVSSNTFYFIITV